MADEIAVTIALSVAKGNLALAIASERFLPDMSGTRYIDNVQNIGTTAEALGVGDVGTAGWAYFKNLDLTNYVEIGRDISGFQAFIKLLPGEACVVRLGTSAPYAKANTAAIDLKYVIIEQ